jgi:tRNA(fMet)-specific endonuclease VapC
MTKRRQRAQAAIFVAAPALARLGEIPVLPFDVPVDTEYGGIRSEFEAAGRPVGANDFLIAAHAYATGATIVTANTEEFKRIRGLKVENWLS